VAPRRRAGQGQPAGQAYLRVAELARIAPDPAGLARAALGLHAIGTRTWWPPGAGGRGPGRRPLAEALRGYHRARDRAARPMYDFTARLAAVSPPTPAEIALFKALARSQEDSDMFLGVLAGSIPLRQFMSPRTMVRLVGVGGFARLALGLARPHRAGAAPAPQPAKGSSARSTEDATAT
jgi:hypothetical protein